MDLRGESNAESGYEDHGGHSENAGRQRELLVSGRPRKEAAEHDGGQRRDGLSAERARVGRYWLGALAMLPHPAGFSIRVDGSERVLGDVFKDVRGGWLTVSGKTGREQRGRTPAECLAWWVAEERS